MATKGAPRVITTSGQNVFSNGKLVGSYADPAAALKAANEYAGGPGNIAGDTGGETFRATRPGAMDAAAAAQAERAKQAGMGAPQSMNAEGAQRQGFETPEQTMARLRSQGSTPPSSPAPAVFTSKDAKSQFNEDVNAFTLADATLRESLTKGQKKETKAPEAPKADTGTTTTTTDTTGGPVTAAQVQNEKLQKIIDENERAYADYKSKVDAIMDGTFELNPSDQATLRGMQESIDRVVNEQRQTNKAQEQGVRILGIRSGRQRYAPEVDAGIIGAEISAGTQRIQEIQSKGAQVLNEARSAMLSKNMETLNSAMKTYGELQKAKSDAISEMYKNVTEAEQAAIAKAKEAREQAKADEEARKEVTKASREGAILDLIGQGVTDVASIVNYMNYDDAGNLVGDITVKEVTDLQEALKKAKKDPGTFQVVGGPSEGLYELQKDADGRIVNQRQILAPKAKATSAGGGSGGGITAPSGNESLGNLASQFESVIINLGSVSAQNNARKYFQKLVDAGNEKEANAYLNRLALQGLNGKALTDYNAMGSVFSGANQALQDIDSFRSTTPGLYKTAIEQAKPFANVSRDQKWVDFTSRVQAAQAGYRNSLLGASLTPQENALANQFLIDFSHDDVETVKTKLENLRELSNEVQTRLLNEQRGVFREPMETTKKEAEFDKTFAKDIENRVRKFAKTNASGEAVTEEDYVFLGEMAAKLKAQGASDDEILSKVNKALGY